MSPHRGRPKLAWHPFAVLLLVITDAAQARPFPNQTVETIKLTSEESIALPTKEAIRANKVWCGTLSDDFDELIICVERTNRIAHFSDKARAQVEDIQQAEPTTAAELKLLLNAIREVQSDARAAERYLRIGTGAQIKRVRDY